MDNNKENQTAVRKNKKRLVNFTADMKKKLAAQVKCHPRIWDVTDRLHCRKEALDQSWSAISEAMNLSPNDCKAAWTSLKESSRYFSKASRKGKSGDAGGEALKEPTCDEEKSLEWEFAEDMDFLPSTSQKRKTFQTFELTSSDLASPNILETESSVPQYDYTPAKKRKRQEDDGANFFDSMQSLMATQQKVLEQRVNTDSNGSVTRDVT